MANIGGKIKLELQSDFSFHLTMDECEHKFQEGILNTQTPDDRSVASMKSTVNCTFEVDGKYVFVSPPSDAAKLIEYIYDVRVYTKSDLESAEDGVYAWIFCKLPGEDDGEPQFLARKVESILEIASLHKAIARAVGAATLHGAGEVKKEGSTLTFNFLSGSYMQLDCNREARETFMTTYLTKPDLFGANAKLAADRMKTFITNPPTMSELQSYANKGFHICFHDSKEECLSKKGQCDQTLKPQEGVMRGGDENLSVTGKKMPLTPRKAREEGIAPEEPSQAALARQVFASKQLLANPRTAKERALSQLGRPISPASVGLGRKRKTRRGKKAKRRMTKKKW